MSFDLYIQSFENGNPAGIPRKLIREIFSAYLTETEPDYWQLTFGLHDSCHLYLSPLRGDYELIHNVTVNRPCSDLLLWHGLAKLLAHEQTTLYFPGCSGPLVTRLSVANHIPPDMLDALGQPILVMDGPDIVRRIQAA